jgi:hypothetical protein
MPTLAHDVDQDTVSAEVPDPDAEEEEGAELDPLAGDDDDDDDDELEARADDETEPPPEPEPAGDPLPNIGPDELRRAELAITAQRKKLAGILGDDYVQHDCPLCAALGFLPELPDAGTRLEFFEGENGLELALAEAPVDPAFVQAKDKAPCDWCDALGFVLSGSQNPNARVVPCSKCSGNGWVTVAADASPGLVPASSQNVPPAAAPGPPAGIGPDAWGRPEGHVHWGVPPSSIGV